jgi:periplasmic protein TonB
MIGGVVLVVFVATMLVLFIHRFMASKDQKPPRLVQNITVIRPPPPPPPEAPPPPEKVEQQIQQNQPEPTPDNEPTPSEQLGLDAEGSAGGDAFGLAARKGGGDLIGTGGAAFAWYTGKLKDQVSEHLAGDVRLRAKKFSVGVRVWIEADGRIKEFKLSSGTGNRDLDGAIVAALSSLGRISEGPPLEMPQPVTLQIISRS